MKKIFAQIGAWIGEAALSFGVGYAWGTLLRKTIGKWFEDEENIENHPKLAPVLAILYLVALAAMPIFWAFGPMVWIRTKVDGFIEDHIGTDKDEFEE